MSKMDKNTTVPQNTKDFIKRHAVLIDAMQFNRFFEDAWDELSLYDYTPLISIMKNIGIDVLQYMHYIPPYFFVDSNMKTYTVTELVTVIKEYAFARCTKLQTIELPNNSSAEDVHRQYRKLIFKYHPDRLSEHQRQNPAMIKEAKEKIEAIYSAYHLICEHQNKKIG